MAIALLALGAAGLLLAWLAAPPSDQRGEPLHLAVGEVVIIPALSGVALWRDRRPRTE